MNKKLKEITNIGIPSYNILKLPIYDMTLTCSNNTSKTIKLEREIRKEAIDRVSKIIGINTFNQNAEYLTNLNFLCNKNSESIIDLTKKERILSIFRELSNLDEELNKQILIKKIENMENKLHEMSTYIQNNLYTGKFDRELKNNFNILLNGRNRNVDLRKYLVNESKYYRAILDNLDEVLKIDYSDMIDDYTNTLNPEKVALFLAYHYLLKFYEYDNKNKYNKAQECLFYISALLETDINRNEKIYLNNSRIDFYFIINRYMYIMKNYKKYKELIYDREMFIGKDIDDNKRIINNLRKMKNILIEESFIQSGITGNTKTYNGRGRKTNSDEAKIKKYLLDRYYVYLKNDPIATIEGTDSFSNYVGFLYKNGMILSDRLLNVNNESDMMHDAIYIFNILNFENDIKLDKQVLKAISNIKPINHINDWEEKIENISKLKTTKEMKQKAKEYVMSKN